MHVKLSNIQCLTAKHQTFTLLPCLAFLNANMFKNMLQSGGRKVFRKTFNPYNTVFTVYKPLSTTVPVPVPGGEDTRVCEIESNSWKIGILSITIKMFKTSTPQMLLHINVTHVIVIIYRITFLFYSKDFSVKHRFSFYFVCVGGVGVCVCVFTVKSLYRYSKIVISSKCFFNAFLKAL